MKILVNHVGYDAGSPKRAVLQARWTEAGLPGEAAMDCPAADAAALDCPTADAAALDCRIIDAASGLPAWQGRGSYSGPVERWKDWVFWSLDFSDLTREGRYAIVLPASSTRREVRSQPFEIGHLFLVRRTVPAVMQYFRSQRCAGRLDEADRSAPFHGSRRDRVDVHGGWYDASGDRGKYLSHLSYTNFMNPQQSPLAVWSFLAARELLEGVSAPEPRRTSPAGTSGAAGGAGATEVRVLRELRRKLLAEALYGADFLLRMQDAAGYFYASVFDGWSQDPSRREICSFRGQGGQRSERYQAGFRQGGGMAIAALARAATACRAKRARAYREAAERGFAHLEESNHRYVDDGRENIIDDYCALLAAVELYRTAGRQEHLSAARQRVALLASRLCADGRYRGWWRAGDTPERPFFHAVEAGLPAIALLRYANTEPDPDRKERALEAAVSSLRFETALTDEVANPFGYARQYVKPMHGEKRSSFFLPHDNDSGYWWQGENARLASLAAAARMAAAGTPGRAAGTLLASRLQSYAADQLNWILGLNPFDTCMLHGFGRNNPEYEATHPNAFGGICNGITGGIDDERDIDFLPARYAAQRAHRWRWSEQWIPHGFWYVLAVCAAAAGTGSDLHEADPQHPGHVAQGP